MRHTGHGSADLNEPKQSQPTPSLSEALVDLEEELRLASMTAWGTWENAIDLRKRTQGLLLEAAHAIEQQASALKAVEEVCEQEAEQRLNVATFERNDEHGAAQFCRGRAAAYKDVRTAIREAKG